MDKKNVKSEVKKQTLGYIVGAFGLVAGLAWNEAIKSLIETIFPLEKNGLIVKFGYAILMTIVLVIMTIYLSRLFKNGSESE